MNLTSYAHAIEVQRNNSKEFNSVDYVSATTGIPSAPSALKWRPQFCVTDGFGRVHLPSRAAAAQTKFVSLTRPF